ncbi:MAG TPA: Sapep family Mn(2+)-dependent dipeptidase [Eubacteriales bacterium]|nr:Sapep family Mn(2+)-dependent dipeptidase [Eubacteriales bacterium]
MNLFDELVNNTLKLIAFPSVKGEAEEGAPFGRENRGALDFTLALAKKLGFKIKDLDGYAGYAEIGEGELFAVLGHLDVVPFGEGWTKSPLGEIDGGYIYGRGIMDNKGPTLSALYAAKRLLDEGYTPVRRLRFIFGCDEESGGWGCMKRYAATEEMPVLGFSPDSDFPVIFAEKGIVNYKISLPISKNIKITAGLRPNVVPNACEAEVNGLKLSTKGTSAHAAHPELGDNAVIKMLRILSGEHPSIKLIYENLSDYYGENCGLAMSDEPSGKLTVNLGMIGCEEEKIWVVVDIRYPVTKTEDEVLKRLADAFPDAEIEKTHFHLPLYVEKSDPLVQSLLASYTKVTGDAAEPIAIGGGTYARAIPAGVAFGPQFPDVTSTIHSPDERVSMADFRKMFEIYYEALKELCFKK